MGFQDIGVRTRKYGRGTIFRVPVGLSERRWGINAQGAEGVTRRNSGCSGFGEILLYSSTLPTTTYANLAFLVDSFGNSWHTTVR